MMLAWMFAYSAALTLALLLSAPWWLFRMATTQRYREGLGERLGRVPPRLRNSAGGPSVTASSSRVGSQALWLHAVSVGEVLAATRLVAELEAALPTHRIVISTTTRTGQALARERFGSDRVFYFPLDFAFAIRAYLNALRPAALILMESELWPRLLHECAARNIPIAVVNARVSDRSFARSMRFRKLWQRMARHITLWLAQSDEDANRLLTLLQQNSVISTEAQRSGETPVFPAARTAATVRVTGNLKYDIRAPKESWAAELISKEAKGRPIIVAGSTVALDRTYEDQLVVAAWRAVVRTDLNAMLVLAPRHPEQFLEVENRAHEYRTMSVSSLKTGARSDPIFSGLLQDHEYRGLEVVVLDTVGDLSRVYALADVAFIGGSLVPAGGHNPLEPAQFGVPVVMGASFENFRDIVAGMQAVDGIRIVQDSVALEETFIDLLTNRATAKALGERGRQVFEQQEGATARTVDAILTLLAPTVPTPPAPTARLIPAWGEAPGTPAPETPRAEGPAHSSQGDPK